MGGWRRWGAMTTDDHGGRVTSSLNDVVRIQGQGDQGTMIIGGITVFAVGTISFASLQSVEMGAENSIVHYVVAIFVIYGFGYPIGQSAIIGLFSKGATGSSIILIYALPLSFFIGDFLYEIKQKKIVNTILTLILLCLAVIFAGQLGAI